MPLIVPFLVLGETKFPLRTTTSVDSVVLTVAYRPSHSLSCNNASLTSKIHLSIHTICVILMHIRRSSCAASVPDTQS